MPRAYAPRLKTVWRMQKVAKALGLEAPHLYRRRGVTAVMYRLNANEYTSASLAALERRAAKGGATMADTSTQRTVFTSTYSDEVRIPDELTFRDIIAARDKVREYGTGDVYLDRRVLTMHFEQDDDWDLRDTLADLGTELRALGFDWEADKSHLNHLAVRS